MQDKNPSGIVGRTPQRPGGGTGEGKLECLENPYWGWHVVSQFAVASFCRRNGFQHRWCKDFAKDVGRALLGKASGLIRTHGMRCPCAHHSFWTAPRKYGPHGELFFFLIKKESLALTEAAQFKPFVPAETLKACALIGFAPDGSRGCIWVERQSVS